MSAVKCLKQQAIVWSLTIAVGPYIMYVFIACFCHKNSLTFGREIMMRFIATNTFTGEVRLLSDRDIDAGGYDIRVWDIKPKRVVDDNEKPHSVIQVLVPTTNKKYKLSLFPIFGMKDMQGLRLSKDGHYFTSKSLTSQQRVWLEHTENLKHFGLAD